MSETIKIKYIPLDEAAGYIWKENAKLHDIDKLKESIWRYGFQDPPKYNEVLGRFDYGNGRVEALLFGREEGREPPRGIRTKSGEWFVPVKVGLDIEEQTEANAFALDHNNLTLLGGDFTPLNIAQMWDERGYLALLENLVEVDLMPVSVDSEIFGILAVDDKLPLGKPPAVSMLNANHVIEIHCNNEALEMFLPTLKEWQEIENVTVNIS